MGVIMAIWKFSGFSRRHLRKIALQEADSLIYFYYLPGMAERWRNVGARKKGDSEPDMKTGSARVRQSRL
jgi:hypothetical protein